MRKIFALAAAFCLILSAVGCRQREATPVEGPVEEQALVQPLVDSADPVAAINKIYESIDFMGLSDADATVLKDKFFIDPILLDSFHVRYSSGRFGLADVFILKPRKDDSAKVREALEQIKLSRMREFESYDIYNSYQTAQDAQVFSQGGYLIMLMVPDPETAREFIDQYIPKN